MKKRASITGVAFLALTLLLGSGSGWADDARMVISVTSDKAVINWVTWNLEYEPLFIKADSNEAVIIFKFEKQPKDPKKIKVTSNAAVYIKTKTGFIPLTERARLNPKPDVEQKRRD